MSPAAQLALGGDRVFGAPMLSAMHFPSQQPQQTQQSQQGQQEQQLASQWPDQTQQQQQQRYLWPQ
jgi:hypothetical protein